MSTPLPIDFAGLSLETTPSAALEFLRTGLVPVPIPYRQKKCLIDEWPSLRPTEADLKGLFSMDNMNIGVLTGEPSRRLLDADLDCPEAIKLASWFLQETDAVFGRDGKPSSHRLYQSSGPPPANGKWADGKVCICEFRSTGVQTVFPPSTHKDTGEPIRFEKQGVAAVVDGSVLLRKMALLATACLLARHWPTGNRHDAALSLSGTLLRAGWPSEECEHFIEAVAVGANDDEVKDRVRAVKDTQAKLAAGEHTTGFPKLGEFVGKEVATKAAEWLELPKTVRRPVAPAMKDRFRVSNGGIAYLKYNRDGGVEEEPLTNFDARIVADVAEDDGVERRRTLELRCTLNGREQPVTLPAREFGLMNWPVAELGAAAIVSPGLGAKDKARAGIQCLSGPDIPSRTVFTHTGWRKIEGIGWVFLHAGGAIGPLGPVPTLETRLEGALSLFRLPAPPTGEDLVTALQASIRLLDLAPDRVSIPVYSGLWRSVMGEVDLSLFLEGTTGVFKSEFTALHQQHFGQDMTRVRLPGSWTSTDNALEDIAFRAKDVLLSIDDFKPSGHSHEDAKLHGKADRVLRGQGNGSGRQRMRSDTSLRPPRPPRGMIMATGEELPKGHSLRSRLVVCQLGQGDIDPKRLLACQKDAASGLYAQAMAAFIVWLAGRWDAAHEQVRRRTIELRDGMLGVHRRTPSNLASLLAGLEVFVQFAVEATNEEALTRLEGDKVLARARKAFAEVAQTQSQLEQESDPADRYLQLLDSAVASGRAHVVDADGGPPPNPEAWGWRTELVGARSELRPCGTQIGWLRDERMYLDPHAAYLAAQSMGAHSDGLGVSELTLRRRLHEKGLLDVTEHKRGKLLARVSLLGARRNVLCMRASLFYEAAQPAQAAQDPSWEVQNGDLGRKSGPVVGGLGP